MLAAVDGLYQCCFLFVESITVRDVEDVVESGAVELPIGFLCVPSWHVREGGKFIKVERYFNGKVVSCQVFVQLPCGLETEVW